MVISTTHFIIKPQIVQRSFKIPFFSVLKTRQRRHTIIRTSRKTPLERQKEKLLCVVDNSEFTHMVMKKGASAYFSQDMAAIKEAFDEKMGNSCDSTPEEDNALIYDRNVNWVASMPAIMSEKSTLFVVGAGHLPGERGVIELLRKEGYTVEAVNSAAQAVVE